MGGARVSRDLVEGKATMTEQEMACHNPAVSVTALVLGWNDLRNEHAVIRVSSASTPHVSEATVNQSSFAAVNQRYGCVGEPGGWGSAREVRGW